MQRDAWVTLTLPLGTTARCGPWPHLQYASNHPYFPLFPLISSHLFVSNHRLHFVAFFFKTFLSSLLQLKFFCIPSLFILLTWPANLPHLEDLINLIISPPPMISFPIHFTLGHIFFPSKISRSKYKKRKTRLFVYCIEQDYYTIWSLKGVSYNLVLSFENVITTQW